MAVSVAEEQPKLLVAGYTTRDDPALRDARLKLIPDRLYEFREPFDCALLNATSPDPEVHDVDAPGPGLVAGFVDVRDVINGVTLSVEKVTDEVGFGLATAVVGLQQLAVSTTVWSVCGLYTPVTTSPMLAVAVALVASTTESVPRQTSRGATLPSIRSPDEDCSRERRQSARVDKLRSPFTRLNHERAMVDDAAGEACYVRRRPREQLGSRWNRHIGIVQQNGVDTHRDTDRRSVHDVVHHCREVGGLGPRRLGVLSVWRVREVICDTRCH